MHLVTQPSSSGSSPLEFDLGKSVDRFTPPKPEPPVKTNKSGEF